MSVTVLPVLTVVSVPTARDHLTAPVTVLGMMAICVKTVSENICGSRNFFRGGPTVLRFFLFFFIIIIREREDPNTTLSGSSLARQQNAIY